MILEANLDVLSSLRGFYKDLRQNEDFDSTLRTNCRGDISRFIALVDDFSHDFNMQIKRSKLLVKITNDRKELVRSLYTFGIDTPILIIFHRYCSICRVKRRTKWRD